MSRGLQRQLVLASEEDQSARQACSCHNKWEENPTYFYRKMPLPPESSPPWLQRGGRPGSLGHIVGKSDFVSGILILESIFPNFSEYFS